MKTNVEALENSRIRLEIEVDGQPWTDALQAAYRKVVKSVSVPGFRKGKVPRPILERQYGAAILFEDAIDILFPEVYGKALEEHDIRPIDQPDLDIKSIDKEEGVHFVVEVDVFPTIELGDYSGLKADKEIVEVTDEEVQEVLDNMRDRQSELVVVDSREDAQLGDHAIIDFTGYLNDEPFSGGAAEDHTLELGSGQFIPGFEEQIVGMKVGEDKDIQVTFPEEYHAENMAGQEVVFKVKLKELKETLLPELDDEFAKDIGEHDTLEALKEDIRKDILEQKERRADQAVEDALIDQLIANSQLNVPKVMVDRQSEYLLQDFSTNLMYQGLTLERYYEITQSTKEQLMENFQPEAERQVKRELLLDALADQEGIEVSDEEVDNKINEIVEGSPRPDDVRKRYEGSKGNIRASLRLEKAVELLVQKAEIIETVSVKEEAAATEEAAE